MVDLFAGVGTVSMAAQWLTRAVAEQQALPASGGFDVSFDPENHCYTVLFLPSPSLCKRSLFPL